MSCFDVYIPRKWILISFLKVLMLFFRLPNLQCVLLKCLWNKNNAPLNKGIEAKAKSLVVRETEPKIIIMSGSVFVSADGCWWQREIVSSVFTTQANSEYT